MRVLSRTYEMCQGWGYIRLAAPHVRTCLGRREQRRDSRVKINGIFTCKAVTASKRLLFHFLKDLDLVCLVK